MMEAAIFRGKNTARAPIFYMCWTRPKSKAFASQQLAVQQDERFA
jgi:hypothetical protein